MRRQSHRIDQQIYNRPLSNNTTFKTVRQYFDGIGRPIQSVAVANSPNLKDVISATAYDNQGRESLKYEPFESTNSNGSFVAPSGQYTTMHFCILKKYLNIVSDVHF